MMKHIFLISLLLTSSPFLNAQQTWREWFAQKLGLTKSKPTNEEKVKAALAVKAWKESESEPNLEGIEVEEIPEISQKKQYMLTPATSTLYGTLGGREPIVAPSVTRKTSIPQKPPVRYSPPTTRKTEEAKKANEINKFIAMAHSFYSDILLNHYRYANRTLNNNLMSGINSDFEKLMKDHGDFVDTVDRIKVNPYIPIHIIDIFNEIRPLEWHSFDTIKPFSTADIDKGVVDIAMRENANPQFIERLQMYSNEQKSIGDLNTKDQRDLLTIYRKYQMDKTWRDLRENREKIATKLKEVSPATDVTWIEIYR